MDKWTRTRCNESNWIKGKVLLLVFIDFKVNWLIVINLIKWGCRGYDRMVVGFTTTYAISAYEFESRSGEVYSIMW